MKAFWLLNLLGLATLPAWFMLFDDWYRPTSVVVIPVLAGSCVVTFLLVHESIHVLAIRAIAPNVQVRWGLRGINPYIRIEGYMTIATRLTFLLTPLVTISLLCWAVAAVMPAAGATCVIVAAANAAGSVADLWRSASLLRIMLRRYTAVR